ncbi:hypothetical protein ScPMuIL_006008 [Solemya velum]
MESLLCCLLLVFSIGYCQAVNCTGLADGTHEEGCKSYIRCTGGVRTSVECEDELVFNSQTKACDAPTNVPAPCGVFKNCSNLSDQKYPDLDLGCASYFTCFRHSFYGHNKCPQGLVFNINLQTCDWRDHAPPPCGDPVSTRRGKLSKILVPGR